MGGSEKLGRIGDQLRPSLAKRRAFDQLGAKCSPILAVIRSSGTALPEKQTHRKHRFSSKSKLEHPLPATPGASAPFARPLPACEAAPRRCRWRSPRRWWPPPRRGCRRARPRRRRQRRRGWRRRRPPPPPPRPPQRSGAPCARARHGRRSIQVWKLGSLPRTEAAETHRAPPPPPGDGRPR